MSEYFAIFMASGRLRCGTSLMKLISFFNFAWSTGRTIVMYVMIDVLGMGLVRASGDEMME